MNSEPSHLSAEEQRQKFEDRGMYFPPKKNERDARKIQEIGYYRLKEFAYPYSSYLDGKLVYSELTFKALLVRYYQDKNLRIFLLHAIEDIEVNLNNQVATLLGNKYGPFGYLRFGNWCDRNRKRFDIEGDQFYFKKDLVKKIKRSNIEDLKLTRNKDSDGFPTVWLMVDTLTFGDTTHLIMLMSTSNKIELAKKYGCTPTELISWLKCLNFIRNVCAHNSNLIDLHLITKPLVPVLYQDRIVKTSSGYSNAIAVVMFITKSLMDRVNPRYNFARIVDSLYKIIDRRTDVANALGFKTDQSIRILKNDYKKNEKR